MWLLEIELESSERAASTLNHWVILPAPVELLFSLKHSMWWFFIKYAFCKYFLPSADSSPRFLDSVSPRNGVVSSFGVQLMNSFTYVCAFSVVPTKNYYQTQIHSAFLLCYFLWALWFCIFYTCLLSTMNSGPEICEVFVYGEVFVCKWVLVTAIFSRKAFCF